MGQRQEQNRDGTGGTDRQEDHAEPDRAVAVIQRVTDGLPTVRPPRVGIKLMREASRREDLDIAGGSLLAQGAAAF